MSDTTYKTGIFFAYQALDALYRRDDATCDDNMLTLAAWCAQAREQHAADAEFTAALELLDGFAAEAQAGGIPTIYDYDVMRAPLVALLESWTRKVSFRAFVQPDTLSPAQLAILPEASVKTVSRSGEIPDTNDGVIQILFVDNYATCGDTIGKIDAIVTVAELLDRARLGFPLDAFDCDRLYLAGKLGGLTGALNSAQIALAGASEAASGLLESEIPGAVALAVPRQDVRHALLSVEAAKKRCSGIKTAVICGGYDFWGTNLSAMDDSDAKSMLGRVNCPALKSRRAPELPKPMRRDLTDPFFERVSDLKALCEKENAALSRRLAALPYYSAEFNPRPKFGGLQFSFLGESKEANLLAAKARAAAAAERFKPENIEANAELLANFLGYMRKKRVQIAVVIPPATKLFRDCAKPEARGAFYEIIAPVLASAGAPLNDLYDSDKFTDADFADYNHLCETGAEKLSRIVAELIG